MHTILQLTDLVRETVKDLKPYASARDEYVSDGSSMIFLDANENPFDNGVNRYPDPYQHKLKAVLASQKSVAEENILLGNGSDEVLDLIFRAFCEPHQDAIITLPPTYGMYKVLAGINAVANREVPLTADFEPDVPAIVEAMDMDTKVVFFCSPNNPTGNAFATERIEAVLARHKGLVVVDEAYVDFSKKESWVSHLKKYPNLIVTQTLSKAYGMAGIRLGICYASKEIITVLHKIKPPYNVNQLTQERALECLSDRATVEEQVELLLKERQKVMTGLKTIPFVQTIYPTDANFILVKVDDAEQRYQQLLQHGIVVRNRSNQPLCHNTLRFSIGTPAENIRLLTVLKTIA